MELPFVSRKKYRRALSDANYWRKRAKFVVNVPYLSIDDVGEVQIYCKDMAQADKILARLKGSKDG